MKGENGTPPTPDWHLPPRDCDRHGGICETPQHCTWLGGDEADLHWDGRGEN